MEYTGHKGESLIPAIIETSFDQRKSSREKQMPMMTLTNRQVIDLVQQLPPRDKRDALLILAEGAATQRQVRMAYAESQLRQLCAQRGLDWDALSEEEREQFIDDLLHEDR
ncbi:MAG: hypothetical protein BroJett015_06310 [Chloroflexota bacterium]|nr:MAG: hypothetical protein BroJett015_06310 [Chloroflexota bacterium]